MKRRLSLLVSAIMLASASWATITSGGTHYLYNVGAQKWLNFGSEKGQTATFFKHGTPLTIVKTNGGYTLQAPFYDANNYLTGTGAIGAEASLTITEVGNGLYTIGSGSTLLGYDGTTDLNKPPYSTMTVKADLTDASSANAQWKIYTKEEMLEALSVDASAGKDATFMIQSPNFHRHDAGCYNTAPNGKLMWMGMEASNHGYASGYEPDYCGFVFNTANVNIYQDITGLPAGIYEVSVQGFSRYGSNTDATGTYANETPQATLYAGEVSTPLMKLTDDLAASGFYTNNKKFGDGYVPYFNNDGGKTTSNSNVEACKAFDYGMYTNNVVRVTVGGEGTLRIGINVPADARTNTWTAFDNFELTYYGSLSTITDEMKQEILASIPTGQMNAEIKANLDAALDAFNKDASIDNYNTLGSIISEAKESVKAYATVKEAIDKAEKTSLSEEARTQYNTAVASIVKAYNEGTLTGDCTAEVAAIEAALDAAVKKDIATSNDKTGLIANPNFNDGKNGWSGEFGTGAVKAADTNPLITAYGGTFDVYQDIEGLENGVYKVQVQAFTRPMDHNDLKTAVANGDALSNESYIYANDSKILIKMITEEYNTDGAWGAEFASGKYIPNSSGDAAKAFNAGMYENELYCIVTDGKLRIGVCQETEEGKPYVGYDNFRLSYCGPVDMTAKIINPKFDDGKNGWNGDFGTGAVKATSTNPLITAYGGTFNVYQDIEGLPNGTYKLQAQAFTRPIDHDAMKTALDEGKTLDNQSYLYANESEKLVKLIIEDYGTTSAWGKEFATGKYAPNSSGDAALAFNAGLYENELLCVVTNGKLRIGIRQESTEGSPYVGYDNFRLTYVSASTTLPEEEEKPLTRDDIMAYLKACKKVADQATDHTAFDNVYETSTTSLSNEDLKEEDLLGIKQNIMTSLANLLKEGETKTGLFDLTPLIANATFDANLDGWKTAKPFTWNSIGVAQLSNGKQGGSLSQVLEGMPAGKYQLKMQGFYRQSGWQEGLYEYEHGNKIEKLSMFFNDTQKNVKSLFEDGRSMLASANISRTEDVGSTVDGRGFPHLSSKVQDIFKPGHYWNYLEAELAEDGNISLGVSLSETDRDDNWAVIDNFRLYYGVEKPVVLSSTNYNIKEDGPAEVKIVKKFIAGELTPFSAPCDIPGSRFKAVYEIGKLNFDKSNSSMTLYPVENVRAGVPCCVVTETDMDTLYVGQTVLRAMEPDATQLIWDGGLVVSTGKAFNWRNTDLTGTQRAASLFKNVEYVDPSNMTFTANMTNHQSRMFLSKSYTQSSASIVSTYNQPAPARRDISHSIGIPVPASKSEGATVKYSLNEDMSDAKTINVLYGSTVCYIPNLVPGNTYFFELTQGDNSIEKGQFTVEGPLRQIYAPSVYNIRDFGGWTMQDGRVTKYGLIYRGGEVNGFHAPYQKDVETLKELGIGAEIDLRYNDSYDQDRETNKSGFGFAHGDTYYFAGANDYTAANLNETGTQARLKEEFQFLMKHIREGKGVYFHCVFGADRTGFFAVLLQGLLGFTLNDLYHDYELTSFAAPAGNRSKSTIQERIAVIQGLSGKTLRDKYENYWINKVGITAEEVEEFRNIMLTDPTPDAINDVIPAEDGEGELAIKGVYSINGTKVPVNAIHSKSGIYVIQYNNGTSKKIVTK